MAFLTPQIDPVLEFDSDGLFKKLNIIFEITNKVLNIKLFALENEGPILPKSNNDEFRPFMRRLPEFKFW